MDNNLIIKLIIIAFLFISGCVSINRFSFVDTLDIEPDDEKYLKDESIKIGVNYSF